MKRCPTFEQFREIRQLAVVNPDNGVRFSISLRDWEGVLWAVAVRPCELDKSDWDNPFVTAHRVLSRETIEEWLGRLRVERRGRTRLG